MSVELDQPALDGRDARHDRAITTNSHDPERILANRKVRIKGTHEGSTSKHPRKFSY
ncbi:hypothetical protein [Primorskyibacter flagellatus]|uniref:hypothetical protein n=1 Tax=Primorskyibacter flagellatus TaxID=1387277 RepID=UPI0015C4AB29|nr:hypothetical protein [Primorskyibacter flagellatus]